ncbi:MAG: hypothetical protein AB9882_13650 [Ignavibacteriaceae bacterium]
MKTTILFIMVGLSLSICLNSQPNRDESIRVFSNKYAIDNLSAGIHGDNLGVKKACIYYAGLYKVNQVFDDLAEVLCENQDDAISKLTILAMYRIDASRTVDFLKDFAKHCDNLKMKSFCFQVVKDFEFAN